jgi:hypothetical protein
MPRLGIDTRPPPGSADRPKDTKIQDFDIQNGSILVSTKDQKTAQK